MAIRKPLPATEPAEPTEHPLTVDDWFALPDDGNQWELFEGVLIRMSPPLRRHQDIALKLARALAALADATGGYAAIAPIGVVLARRIGFEPDVVFVAPEHLDSLSERGLEEAPDIVVEVGSPSTGAFDRNTKLRTYLEHGVREVWLVDPDAGQTEVVTAKGRKAAAFGEPIPSAIAPVGDAGLGAFAPKMDAG